MPKYKITQKSIETKTRDYELETEDPIDVVVSKIQCEYQTPKHHVAIVVDKIEQFIPTGLRGYFPIAGGA